MMTSLAHAQQPSGTPSPRDNDTRATAFIDRHMAEVVPLEIAVANAWWVANTTGGDADYEAKVAAETRLDAKLADTSRFAELSEIHNAPLSDPLVARQIHLLYLQYQGKQVDPELLARMTAKANAIEQAFNVFRARVGDEELTDSQVREVLRNSTDSARRRAVWEASKEVGRQIEADIRELVQLRNEAARRLGYDNFHAMMLALNEQDPQEVLALFDELDALTAEPFRQAKREIDEHLAAKYGVTVDELRPWHYQDPFFQEAPDVSAIDLDEIFANTNIIEVCSKFYAGIGLPIDDVIARSDLYEKPGKSPHAFCTDIDRQGDVRVLANIVPNEYWMNTMLHELGHSVYSSKFIPRSLPYVVRREAHILTTEGLAMMFERLASDSRWLAAMGVEVPDPRAYDEAASQKRRYRLLVFSRWCQVMLRFEMGMYANPDQDLNKLWWDLVEKYQLVRRPDERDAPDYGSKIHIVSAPCYYHNYMMGELFACQVHHAMAREILGADNPTRAVYYDNPKVGEFLTEKIFEPGAVLPWYELARHATGQPLGAAAFAQDFGGGAANPSSRK
jgi:peptidyl-dipeptidase A